MLRDGSTEPMLQRGAMLQLPGAARAAQTIQAQTDIQDTMTTLADQLLVLFDEIPCAGLIQRERRAMHKHVQTYFRLADGAWEAVATDQLTELAGNRAYAATAETLEEQLVQIHEACRKADQNPQARGGWLWRRRVRLYSRALLDWKRCIDTGGALPDATTCGRILYRAHGRVGLAGVSGFDQLLVMALPVLGVLASLLLAFVFGGIDVRIGAAGRALAPTALSSLIALYILWFSTAGPSPLPLVVGYALSRRQPGLFVRVLRVTGLAEMKPGLLRWVLRAFLTILGTLFFAGLVALLALSILFAYNFFTGPRSSADQSSAGSMNSLLQSLLGHTLPFDPYLTTIMLPVLSLVIIALFFLPFTLSVQARMTKALLAHPTRSPEARRYALRPALELLSFHTITLFFLALLANSYFDLGTTSILPPSLPPLTWRSVIYVAALILPYVLLIDLPYRRGIARWRAVRLRDLAMRRNEIAQRLSHAMPQPADQTDLRTVQDYLTWQYYRTQESEVKEAPLAPFSIERRVIALALTILTGIALDQVNTFLHSLLQS